MNYVIITMGCFQNEALVAHVLGFGGLVQYGKECGTLYHPIVPNHVTHDHTRQNPIMAESALSH